jgi:small basic protein (TIGR04137 family)
MSIHKSLVSSGRLKRHRNVLTRTERIATLEKDEKWTEDDSVFSLPKVRVIRIKRAQTKKKVAAEEEGAEVAKAETKTETKAKTATKADTKAKK